MTAAVVFYALPNLRTNGLVLKWPSDLSSNGRVSELPERSGYPLVPALKNPRVPYQCFAMLGSALVGYAGQCYALSWCTELSNAAQYHTMLC